MVDYRCSIKNYREHFTVSLFITEKYSSMEKQIKRVCVYIYVCACGHTHMHTAVLVILSKKGKCCHLRQMGKPKPTGQLLCSVK